MGLYHLHIRPGKTESVLQVAKSTGINLLRTTADDNGTHYFFTRPTQKKEIVITIWKDKAGEEFVRMGASPTSHALAKSFEDVGLIIPFEFKSTPNQPPKRSGNDDR